MRRSIEFASVVRGGTRAGSRPLVVHQLRAGSARPAQVGFVVNKAVGGSVVRHRVARRLRAQVAQRLSQLPSGSATVVRALPAAGAASSAELGAALDRAFSRLAGR